MQRFFRLILLAVVAMALAATFVHAALPTHPEHNCTIHKLIQMITTHEAARILTFSIPVFGLLFTWKDPESMFRVASTFRLTLRGPPILHS